MAADIDAMLDLLLARLAEKVGDLARHINRERVAADLALAGWAALERRTRSVSLRRTGGRSPRRSSALTRSYSMGRMRPTRRPSRRIRSRWSGASQSCARLSGAGWSALIKGATDNR